MLLVTLFIKNEEVLPSINFFLKSEKRDEEQMALFALFNIRQIRNKDKNTEFFPLYKKSERATCSFALL